MAAPVKLQRFGGYVSELRGFASHAVASGGLPFSSVELARAHLDGRVSHELRRRVDLTELRALGAFFTGEQLARKAIALVGERGAWSAVADPACGCGDLLLAAASRLPVRRDLEETLQRWGRVLRGVDIVPEFVEIARLRLMILAMSRGAKPSPGREYDLAGLLPGILVSDGRDGTPVCGADLVLLNPPYGQVQAPAECEYSSGRTSDAALWLDVISSQMQRNAWVVAVLPDVLRSGSRYGRWRTTIASRLKVREVVPAGQFDPLTDVDVFLMAGQRSSDATGRWSERLEAAQGLHQHCAVMVGSVVDRRDAHLGPWVPYITARDLPQGGSYRPSRKRRFAKRLFAPPFVVVRRTSRPTVAEPRLRPVVLLGDEPVAVENHLLVLIPRRQTETACRQLAERLQQEWVTDWLNQRIRLRHLTVDALRDLPIDRVGRQLSRAS